MKKKTSAQLKKKLDTIFSRYIRLKHSKPNGDLSCYTCGKIGTLKTMQCGHFVSRQYLATRWDEDNCRPQEVGCNVWGNGKPLDFEEKLKRELGEEKVEELKRKRHQILKLSPQWYEEQISHYEKEVIRLEDKNRQYE